MPIEGLYSMPIDSQEPCEIFAASAMAFKIDGGSDGSTPVFWCLKKYGVAS